MKLTTTTINRLINNKSRIIENTIQWQKNNFAERTHDYEKCSRDLNIVLTAYIDDLKSDSTRNITYVGSKYWFNDIRQISDHNTEIAIHNYMIEYINNNILLAISDQEQLLNLKNILIKSIEFGPEYMTYSHMHKYRYIMEYDTEDVPDLHLIKQSLYEAWNTTPSKQNFMPYNIFVLGPEDKKIKELIYYKALVREYFTNSDRYDIDESDPVEIEKAMLKHRTTVQYINFKTAPYIVICTQRVETKSNPFNQSLTDRGWNFEQTDASWQNDPKAKNRAQGLMFLEVGMFVQSFSNLCLMHGIDVSYTRCLPVTMDFWSEPEFSFLENPPQFIMTIGKGKVSRREFYPDANHGIDYRPDFERVVKFITKTNTN
jgi:hypothetical protein